MTKKQDNPVYDVVRSQDQALVIVGVDRDTALSERSRLNAEAKQIVNEHNVDGRGTPNPHNGQPTGMYMGEQVTYDAVERATGLVVAS